MFSIFFVLQIFLMIENSGVYSLPFSFLPCHSPTLGYVGWVLYPSMLLEYINHRESSKTKMFALPKFTENVVASPQFLSTILFLNSLPFLFFLHDHFIPSGSAGGSPLLLSKLILSPVFHPFPTLCSINYALTTCSISCPTSMFHSAIMYVQGFL